MTNKFLYLECNGNKALQKKTRGNKMVDSKQIEAYCKEKGWDCCTTHGKTKGKRCIYPHVWRTDNDRQLSNWWTIVIYRDEMDYTEMTKIMDDAFETIIENYK